MSEVKKDYQTIEVQSQLYLQGFNEICDKEILEKLSNIDLTPFIYLSFKPYLKYFIMIKNSM